MTDKRKHVGFIEGYVNNGFIDKKSFIQNEIIITDDYTTPEINEHEPNISLPLTQSNSEFEKNNEDE